MISIGSDIVDLKITNIARTCKPQFYSKILSPAEQLLYNNQLQIPFQHFVWLLWSVKESAYKYLQRHQPDLVFSPVKITIKQIEPPAQTSLFLNSIEKTGFNEAECFKIQVVFNDIMRYARAIIYNDELIHTVVCAPDNFENISWGIKKTDRISPEGQSAAGRSFLLDRLNFLYPDKDVTVSKSNEGVPFIIIDQIIMPVSLSHHGDYVGYAMPHKL